MPQAALKAAWTSLTQPPSSQPPGRILPHARAPPPVQARDGRHVVFHRVNDKATPRMGDRECLLKIQSVKRGNR
jgi:hypothetical protein